MSRRYPWSPKDPMEGFRKQVRIQQDAEQEVAESQGMPEDVSRLIALEERFLDDEILDKLFFDYRSQFFSKAYLFFAPLRSRLIAVGNLSETEIRHFDADLELATIDALTIADSDFVIKMCEHIGNGIKWGVRGRAHRGFLTRSFTETRKIVTMMRGQEKERRW